MSLRPVDTSWCGNWERNNNGGAVAENGHFTGRNTAGLHVKAENPMKIPCAIIIPSNAPRTLLSEAPWRFGRAGKVPCTGGKPPSISPVTNTGLAIVQIPSCFPNGFIRSENEKKGVMFQRRIFPVIYFSVSLEEEKVFLENYYVRTNAKKNITSPLDHR